MTKSQKKLMKVKPTKIICFPEDVKKIKKIIQSDDDFKPLFKIPKKKYIDTSGKVKIIGERDKFKIDTDKLIRTLGASARLSCEEEWIKYGCPPDEFEYLTTQKDGSIRFQKGMCFFDKDGKPINRE